MTVLHLEPTQDRSSIRLMPANYCVFIKHNGRWVIDMDSAIDATVAGVIFNAYHTLKMGAMINANRLCDTINRTLTGQRIVVRDGCVIERIGAGNVSGLISTKRVVPALHNNTANKLGIYCLLNSMGVLPDNTSDIKCQYDATMYDCGGVRVYVADMLMFNIQCTVG